MHFIFSGLLKYIHNWLFLNDKGQQAHFFFLLTYILLLLSLIRKYAMKKILLLVLIASGTCCLAQSKDDMTDTRKKNEGFKKIPQKEIRADLASFTMAGIDESVAKGDITKIPFSSVGPDFMTFEGGNIKATVTTAPFVPSKHKLDYDEKYLIKIDRKTYYGDYGSVPKRYVSNVTVIIDKDTVAIPATAYFDLYNLNLSYSEKGKQLSTNGIYKSKDGHRIYLYLFSKDNSGSYEVTWVIQDKQFMRRVLDYGFM